LPVSWEFPLRGCGLGATEAAGSQAGSTRRPNTQALIPPAGVDLAAENARLRRENERLRMEREILKKTLRIFSEAPK
jgi:transposase